MSRSVNYKKDRKEATNIGKRKLINTLDGSIIDGKDIANLDITICNFVLPRLRAFRLYSVDSCPVVEVDYNKEPKNIRGSQEYSLMFEEWLNILDKMILAFEYYIQPECKNKVSADKKEEVIREGFYLFGKYLTALW